MAATPDDVQEAVNGQSGADEGSPLTGALSSLINPPASLEGRKYAEQIVKGALSGDAQSGEKALFSDLGQNAESARQMLRQARERLMQQQITPEEQRYAQAAAWFAPSRTGAFSENVGNALQVAAEQAKQRRLFGQSQGQQDLGLAEQLQGVDTNLLNARLKLQEMHEAQRNALVGPALRVLAAPMTAKSLGIAATSQIGKQVEDELGPGALQTAPGKARMHDLLEASVAEQKARAGIDVNTPSTGEQGTIATDYGVPANVRAPWENQPTHVANNLRQMEGKKAEDTFKAYPAADSSINAALRAIDEFQQLNEKTHTGPELAPVKLSIHAGLHGAGVSGGDHGINLNPISWFQGFKPSVQTMDKDASQVMGLAIPEKGFGRVTNLDMGIFQKGTLGIDKDKQTNDAVARALRIRLNNDRDFHQFSQNFYNAHHHLVGVDAAWQTYLDDNPIFSPTKTDPYALNPNRKDWRTYFKEHNAKLGFHGSQGEATPEHVSTLTREQLHGVDPNDPALEGLSDEEKIAYTTPAKAAGGRIGFAEGGSTDGVEKALNALRSGATYKLSRGAEDKESPGENFGLEAVGGGATAAALALLARRVGLTRALPWLAEHPATTSSLVGAGAGAISGGASSQDQNPSYDVLSGAATGAMAGPLTRLATRSAVGGVGNIVDRIQGQPVGAGARRVIDAIHGDNPDWTDVANRLRADARMRVPSTLAESVGPRTQGLAQAALARDTPQAANFATDLAARQEGAQGRVLEQINRALKPDPYAQKEQGLKTALYTNAKPLYEQAYQQHPAVKSQALMDLMSTPSGQEAATRAVRMMQDAQVPVGTPDATGMIRNPSLQYLDYVKRALDDMVGREEGVGLNYQATSQGRVLRAMRNKLVAETDQATQLPTGQPGLWQQARQQYGGDLEVSDALRSGRDDFQKLTPEDLATRFGNMSFAEKDAFRSGVAENLFQRLGKTGDTQNPAQRISSTPALREKLGALFDTPAQADRFVNALTRESELFNQSRPLLRAAQRGQETEGAGPSLATLARSRLMGRDTAGDIAQTLSASGPDIQPTLARLRSAADRLNARTNLGNQLGIAGAAGAGTALTPAPEPQ